MRRIPRPPVSYADANQARRRRLPAKWLAAMLITGVNIVAGLVIGVFQQGLDLATAAQTYSILTVGEGLVTAIPALLVSMSGGLITTRAAS